MDSDDVLVDSLAMVEIYNSDGLIRKYNIPVSGTGQWWNVFSYNGSTGEITTIDKIEESNTVGWEPEF